TGCSCDLLINIALTLLGYIPGHLHSFYLIYKKIQAEERFGPDVQYFGNAEWGPGAGAAQQGPVPGAYQPVPSQPQQQQQTTYGTA
ncbi:hypothetical protein JCM3774_000944, partial [Rhodotorula dairenensis]